MRAAVCVALMVVVFPANSHAQDHAPEFAKLSPFEAVRWEQQYPQVQLQGQWYDLVAINDVPAREIVSFCRNTYRGKWQKRFDEDLVEVLSTMGKPPGETVTLKVRALDGGEERTLENVRLTAENRARILEARRENSPQDRLEAGRPQRVERAHAKEPAEAFRFLLTRVDGASQTAKAQLTARQAEHDLDELEWHLEHRFAYLQRKGVDYRAAFDTVRSGIGERISVGAFTVQLMKLLALFGDGHTGLGGWIDPKSGRETPIQALLPAGSPPFLIGMADGKLVAFEANRNALVESGHPYIHAIDGIPIAKWVESAGRLSAQGSPQWVARESARNLRFIACVRADMGLPPSTTVRFELSQSDGERTKSVTAPLRDRPAAYGKWPDSPSRRLEGDIGYIRLAVMEPDRAFTDNLEAQLREFRDTKGLIIDVRGNTGGSRDALVAMLPYFMPPEERATVVNIAAYRLLADEPADAPEGYLADRDLYPRTSSEWTEAERDAIAAAAAKFTPEWIVPEGQFSAWHYFVVSRPDKPGLFHYDKPVVILQDENCFSATDIFLGAFKGRPNVTLMGTASGGGSGRASAQIILRHSRLKVEMSTMASFRPTGQLYDGRGIEPDVLVPTIPTDLLGKSDRQLETALERLRK